MSHPKLPHKGFPQKDNSNPDRRPQAAPKRFAGNQVIEPDRGRELNIPQHIRAKQAWKPATLLSPVPAVMVSCAGPNGRPNIVTVAWAGTVCSHPPMVSISLRPATLSHSLIGQTGEFVVNIPSVQEVSAMDFCGVASGRDVDKFAKTGLTAAPASRVAAPLIAQCPLNMECAVRQTHNLGSHTMFIAEILAVQAAEDLIDKSGRFALEKAGLVAYAHGNYYELGRALGHFGFSVRKKKTVPR